jgi:phosphoglycolate phosphatase
MLRLATLDVAGTTVQITDRVPTSLMEALASHGYAVSEAQVREVRGISKKASIARLIGDRVDSASLPTLVDAALKAFRSSLFASYEACPVLPVQGAARALEELRDRGMNIWLTTGFDRSMADPVVEQAGLLSLVDGIACDDDVAMGRPAPDLIQFAMGRSGVSDPAQVLAAGDTVADLMAASAARVGCAVGVLSGAHDHATLSRAPHDFILDSIAKMPAVLSREDSC